jgi:hypothetical protein
VSREHVLKRALRLIGLPDNDRAQVCVVALRDCAGDIGRPPTSRDYEAWRLEQPNPDLLPKRGYIENTFGRWKTAIAWIDGGFAPDIRWRGNGSAGEQITTDEIARAINEWLTRMTAVETTTGLKLAHPNIQLRCAPGKIGLPACTSYVEWARNRQDARRRPLTRHVIRRHFGSWENAITAARKCGVIDADVDYLLRLALLSESELTQIAVRLVSEAVDDLGIGMQQKDFDAWRLARAENSNGERQRIAKTFASTRICAICRSWKAAIAMATGTPLRNVPGRGAPQIDRAEAIRALRLIGNALGVPPSPAQYEEERESHGERLPHDRTIAREFGSWAAALETAFGGATK